MVNTNFDRHKKKKKKIGKWKKKQKKKPFPKFRGRHPEISGNAAESTEMENGIMHNPNRTRLGLELCMCGGPHCNLFQWLKAVSEND